MESTLLPAAERLWHRRQEDASCIFSSHSAMMVCDRSQRSAPPPGPRRPPAALGAGIAKRGVLGFVIPAGQNLPREISGFCPARDSHNARRSSQKCKEVGSPGDGRAGARVCVPAVRARWPGARGAPGRARGKRGLPSRLPAGRAGPRGPRPASGPAALPAPGSAWAGARAPSHSRGLPSAWPPGSRCEPAAAPESRLGAGQGLAASRGGTSPGGRRPSGPGAPAPYRAASPAPSAAIPAAPSRPCALGPAVCAGPAAPAPAHLPAQALAWHLPCLQRASLFFFRCMLQKPI